MADDMTPKILFAILLTVSLGYVTLRFYTTL